MFCRQLSGETVFHAQNIKDGVSVIRIKGYASGQHHPDKYVLGRTFANALRSSQTTMGAIVSHEIAAQSRAAEVLSASPSLLSTQSSINASFAAEADDEVNRLKQQQKLFGVGQVPATTEPPRLDDSARFDTVYRRALAGAAARRENAERRRSSQQRRRQRKSTNFTSSASSLVSLSSAENPAAAINIAPELSLRLTPPSTTFPPGIDGEAEKPSSNADDDGYCMRLKPFANQVGGHAALLSVQNSDIVCKPLIPRELDFYKNPPEQLAPFLAKLKGIYDVKMARNSTVSDGNVSFVAKPLTASDEIDCFELGQTMQKRRQKRAMSIIPVIKSASRHPNPFEQFQENKTLRQKASTHGCLVRSMSLTSNNRAEAIEQNALADTNLHSEKAWSVRCLDQTVQKFHAQEYAAQKFLALESVISRYRRPCIIDLKMGIQQYGDDATAAKKRSQTLKSSTTTSVTLGVRACGMQVYRYDVGRYVTCDKYFGRKLDNAGFERLLHSFLFNGLQLLRRQLLLKILNKLRRLYRILSDLDGYRFFSSSLLVIYEGCTVEDEQLGPVVGDEKRELAKRRFSTACNSAAEVSSKGCSRSVNREVDVRMIDFAHTTMRDSDKKKKDAVVHSGPDTGYLFGLNNLIRIFQELSNEMID